MIRVLRLLLVVLLAVPVLVLTAPPPAQACSCAFDRPRSFVRASDDVFVATLLGSLLEGGGTDGDLEIETEAEVTRVYAGDVPERVTVQTVSQSSACGLTGLREGQSLLLVGSLEDGAIAVGLCGPPTKPSPKNLRVVERLLGPGEVVRPSSEPSSGSAAVDDEPASAVEPRGAVDDGSGVLSWVPAGAGLVLLAAAAGLALRSRRA